MSSKKFETTELTAALKQILATRHSCRGFLPTPVDKATITSVLEDAQRTCSNCNTQPWHVVVVSGAKLKELSAAYIEAFQKEGFSNGTGDFVFDTELFTGPYKQRQQDQGKAFFEACGIGRTDTDARLKLMLDNFNMYGAPHTALFFMPDVKEGNVRQASDIGQYAMTFMLSCVSHGLACLPQTTLGMKSDVPKKLFNVPEGYKMLFGVSFGHEDVSAPGNSFRIDRAPVEQSVVFFE